MPGYLVAFARPGADERQPQRPVGVQLILRRLASLRQSALMRALRSDGPVERHRSPTDAATILLSLDSPTLFGPAAMQVITGDDRWLDKHREAILAQVGPATAGVALIAVESCARNTRLAKAVLKAEAWHDASAPDRERQFTDWLVKRVHAVPGQVDDPRRVAAALVQHRGCDGCSTRRT